MTPARSLKERWKGERQSTHVEDRRGIRLPSLAPSDSAGMQQRGGLDLNAPITTGWENDVTHVPVEKARLDTARAYVSNLAPYVPTRRKRSVRY